MSYVLKTNLSNRANYGNTRKASDIKYIVIHYTANDGDTDENNGKYFAGNVVKASAHYFVDDNSVTRSVPDLYAAYAVGGKKWNDCAKTGGGKLYGKVTNKNSLSIELCDTRKDGKLMATEATLANAAALCKELMQKYNVDIDHVVRHFDVNGKHCPVYFMDSAAWSGFKARLAKDVSAPAKADSGASTSAKKVEVAKSFNKQYKKAWTTTANLNMRTGAGVGKNIITTLKKGATFRCYGYYNSKDGAIWLYGVADGKTGFCSKAYLK